MPDHYKERRASAQYLGKCIFLASSPAILIIVLLHSLTQPAIYPSQRWVE